MNQLLISIRSMLSSNRSWRGITCAVALLYHATAPTLVSPTFAVEFIEIIEKHKEQPEQNRHGMRIENFPQWVFQEQLDAEGARNKLLERLGAEAESIQSTFQLSEDQAATLKLAGLGDIEAFTQEYAKTRASFEKNINDQQAIQNIWQEIQPLQIKYQGQIFRDDSLFNKVMKHLLNEQQLAVMEQLQREQLLFQYQASVREVVIQIDQAAPITHEKRQQLLELINQHTLPPKSMPGTHRGHFLTYYILGQFAEIPEDELRPLFRDAAWKALQRQMKQARAMKRQLEQQGLVPGKG